MTSNNRGTLAAGWTHGASHAALIIAAALAAGAPPALAADEAAEEERDTVVVTSRYREESVQSTPIAVTAISEAELEMRSIVNVEDLGAVIPNAFFRENVGNFGPTSTIGLRGIIQQDFSYAFEPAVALYIDDVYHGTLTGSDMDLLDLQRVEVLRGPQGTLYGKNSIGGNIRLISRQPEGDNSGSVEVTYGERNRIDLKGVADFTLVDDRMFARVSGASKRQDGYGSSLDFTCEMTRLGTPELAGVGDGLAADGPDADTAPDAVTPGSAEDNAFALPASRDPVGGCELYELGSRQSDSARVMLRMLATPDLEFNFSADVLNSESTPLPQTLLTPHMGGFDAGYSAAVITPAYGIGYTDDARFVTGDPYTNYANYADPLDGQVYDPTNKMDAWGVSGTADWDLADAVSLKVIAAYRTYESAWASDTDLTPFPVQGTDYIQEHEQTQLEARLGGVALDDRFEWVTGLFYYDAESRAYNTTEFGAFDFSGLLLNFTADDYYTTETASVFAHGIFDLTSQLSVSGGVRYTEEEKGNIFNHQPGLPVTEATFSGDRVDWKISLDYQATDDIFIYGQAATGFRSAGFTPRIFTVGQLQPVDPEEVLTYEIGAKLDLLDTLRINSAVYYSEYDPRLIQVGGVNQCDAVDDPNPTPYQLQGGNCPPGTFFGDLPEPGTGLPWFFYSNVPGELRGFETEATWAPVENLAINASLGWNEYEDPTRDSSSLLQPEWTAAAGVQYTFDINSSSAVTPRLDWSYQSHRTNGGTATPNVCPDQCIEEYNLLNARVVYDNYDNDWSLAFGVTNLTDEFYWQQLGAAVTNTGGVPSARTGVPSRPREWYITATKRF